MAALTSNELQLVQKFKNLISKSSPCLLENLGEEGCKAYHLIRWIRAREGNLEQALQMLTKSVEWRKKSHLAPKSLIFNWHPPTFLTSNFPVYLLGFDTEGCPIVLFRLGQWDLRRVFDLGKGGCGREPLVKYNNLVLESIMKLMTVWDDWTKNNTALVQSANVTQFIGLTDWEGFSLRYIMSKDVVDVILEIAQSFEANYPETLKKSFNINCPAAFTVLFNLVKPFLSQRTISKIVIHGSEQGKWRNQLREVIHPKILPEKYGGLRENDGDRVMRDYHSYKLHDVVQQFNVGANEDDGFKKSALNGGPTLTSLIHWSSTKLSSIPI